MQLLRAREVALMLRVTEARVYELARRKLLPHIKLGRQVRFSENLLREWVEHGGTVCEDETGEFRSTNGRRKKGLAA
jgi:excisionase family DNA binding protein